MQEMFAAKSLPAQKLACLFVCLFLISWVSKPNRAVELSPELRMLFLVNIVAQQVKTLVG